MGKQADRRRNGSQRLNYPYCRNTGCSRRTARDVVAKVRMDWIEAFIHEDINTRDLLFQQVGRLERIARKQKIAADFLLQWVPSRH